VAVGLGGWLHCWTCPKAYYGRTNKDVQAFTRQLVVQSEGARRIFERHVLADEAARLAHEAAVAEQAAATAARQAAAVAQRAAVVARQACVNSRQAADTARLTAAAAAASGDNGTRAEYARNSMPGRRNDAAPGGRGTAPDGRRATRNEGVAINVDGSAAAGGPQGSRRPRAVAARPVSSAGGGASGGCGSTSAACGTFAPATPTTAYHLDIVEIRTLAQRPNLANAASLLGVDEKTKVRVASRVQFTARFGCGTELRQLFRASTDAYGAPWYDAVMYRSRSRPNALGIGEVRAILRLSGEDVAIVCCMQPVEA